MKYFILNILLFTLVFELSAQRTWEFEKFKDANITSPDTVYVVNFWATWCLPCVKELPEFEKSIQKYNGKPVKFFFLSLDFGDDAWQKANDYLDKKNYSFDSFLITDDNANEWIPMVNKSWSGAIPATVMYKKDQQLFHEGKITYEKLNSMIRKLLN